MKIPKIELLYMYIYYQRQITGSLSCFQIGPPDIQEHNKLKAKAQRKQRTIEREKKLFQDESSTFAEDVLLEKSSTEEDSSVGSCCELALDQIQSGLSERNTEKVENITLEAMRYSVGLRTAAAIATAAWIDAGVITQGSTYLAIDHSKIK